MSVVGNGGDLAKNKEIVPNAKASHIANFLQRAEASINKEKMRDRQESLLPVHIKVHQKPLDRISLHSKLPHPTKGRALDCPPKGSLDIWRSCVN